MTTEPWLHAYLATPAGSGVRRAWARGQILDVPDAAYEYKARWEQLQARIAAGEPVPRGDVVSVSRPIVDAAQADSSAEGRVDLTAQMHDLVALPAGAGDFFHELLSAKPDRATLRRLAGPFSGKVRFEKDGMQSVATLYFRGGDYWPDTLGGTWGSEVMRAVTLHCRYAKWRDRRVRRLGRVQVTAFDVAPAE